MTTIARNRCLAGSFVLLLPVSLSSCSSRGDTTSGQDGADTPAAKSGATVPAGPGASDSDTPVRQAEARALVKQMRRVYAECESYADAGKIVTVLKGRPDAQGLVSEQRFYTDFLRPGRFRFELRSKPIFATEWERFIAWGRGETVRIHGVNPAAYRRWLEEVDLADSDDPDEAEDNDASAEEAPEEDAPEDPPESQDREAPAEDSVEEPPDEALGAPTETWESILEGVTMASAVPALLMPKWSVETDLNALTELSLMEDETVDGRACHKIVGRLSDKPLGSLPNNPFWNDTDDLKIRTEITLWIDRERQILRKVFQRVSIREEPSLTNMADIGNRVLRSFFAETTQSFEPRLNEKPSWHALVFAAPGHEGRDESAFPIGATFKPTKKGGARARAAAERILARTRKVYAECGSYRDKGLIEAASVDREIDLAQRLRFSTAFLRPARFRFESRRKTEPEGWKRQIIWSDDAAVRSWQHERPGVQDWDSLRSGIDAMAGIAPFVARSVPGMLMGETVGASFLDSAQDLRLMGTQKVDGKSCYVVAGKDAFGLGFRIWIEKKRKVVRRLEAANLGEGSAIWLTLTYDPHINKKVSKKYLKFNAPEAGA